MAVLIKGVLGELINRGGGGGGKLKSGGLVSGQKTVFQNFVKQDSLKKRSVELTWRLDKK